MRLKKGKTRNVKRGHGLEVNVEAMRILRTVNPSESFYFYEAIGKPTGQNASNLRELLETVKSVKIESLQFHQERKDFQNWIAKTLGDTALAKKIGDLSTKPEANSRARIQSTLEERIKELARPILTMIVNTEKIATRQELKA
jgi:tryptophan 2,3-dioxygenase